MIRKIVAVWVSLVIMFGFIVIVDTPIDFIPTVKGVTLYVNETGSGGAFTKIQDAINDSNDGDTVYVYNGTYFEHVIVNKSINLTGEDRNTTIINGGGSGFGYVVMINVDWVNITGFTITSGFLGNYKGLTVSSSYNTISYNNIIGNNNYGIDFKFSSQRNNITANNISSNKYGAIRLYSQGNNISGNTISSNSKFGIFLDSAGGNKITNNYIFSNDNLGLYLWSTNKNNVKGNIMINDGIYVWGDQLEHWNTHEIDTSNTVNSKPVYYWKNKVNGTVPMDAGQIILANCSNLEIKNLELLNTSVGLELGFSPHNNVTGSKFSDNYYGIYQYRSSDINIEFNDIHSNLNDGLSIYYSNMNNIANNDVSSNGRNGIYLFDSGGSKIIGNNAISNIETGIFIESSSNNNITGNYIKSNKKYGLHLSISSNNNITNNDVIMNKALNRGGVYLQSCSNNNIINNNFSYNYGYGLYLYLSSDKNIIAKNDISSNDEYGICIKSSAYNNIINNDVSSNGWQGIMFRLTSENNITNNNITNNGFGSSPSVPPSGIYLLSSSNNNILVNNVSQNKWGIFFESSSENRIFHNNIIANTDQAYDDMSDNLWNNTYPSGGNYWSDYIGVDNFKGPNQDVPGSDGIGDTNYSIDLNSIDYYPLMEPFQNYVTLKQGWNLISIPLIQQDQNLIKVLNTIDGLYDAVQWYDSTNTNDPWKHNKIGKPMGNDLNELNETLSFWIHITQPGDTIFVYNGTQPTSNQTIPLHPGWNMVGYPSLTTHNRTEGLNNLTFDDQVDAIWSYDADTQRWEEMGESDYFQIGKGYYIHAKSECEWEVQL